jgi:phosphate-selective porin OprO and OprP
MLSQEEPLSETVVQGKLELTREPGTQRGDPNVWRHVSSRIVLRASLGLALSIWVAEPTSSAQDSPAQGPLEVRPNSQPAIPSPTVPPTVVAPGSTAREAQLEERVRQLEAMVKALSTQMSQLSSPGMGGPAAALGTAGADIGTPAQVEAPSATGGPGAPGQSLPPNPAPSSRFNSPATLDNIKANVKFGPGFEIRTNDDEYIFQFHDLTQFDYRGHQQGGQAPVKNTFAFPRQWYMFSGRLSMPFGYFVAIAAGFDVISILDAFGDVDYDPRVRVRIGRFKTPFTYEFFVEPIQGLTTPERSLFFNNFALNRDNGFMVFGRLFDERIDYAAALTNGTRNGLIDFDNSKDVVAFLNFRPFGDEQNTLLENFNIGGSTYAGDQHHTPAPGTFRTVVPTAGSTIIGVPFLSLNTNVVNSGFSAFWDLHVSWLYRQLAVISEWGSGFETYAHASTTNLRTQLPVQSFYVQASYFLTGETISSLGIVKPDHPFDLRAGKRGTGALEPFFRYDYMDINKVVFTNGLADPNLWANRLFMTDVGLNWHLTQYIKMYFDWNHAEFNQPVVFAPGRRQSASDTFWVRFQMYF